ncbi:MAG: CinA family protein, partial [Alphaproteobacteria bacterium]
SSEVYAQLLANRIRQRFASDWGLSETGATGPGGNRYGDAAGHSCMAVAGPQASVITLETGSTDRQANMQVFAASALKLLLQNLSR